MVTEATSLTMPLTSILTCLTPTEASNHALKDILKNSESLHTAFENLKVIGVDDWSLITDIRRKLKKNTDDSAEIQQIKDLFLTQSFKIENGKRKLQNLVEGFDLMGYTPLEKVNYNQLVNIILIDDYSPQQSPPSSHEQRKETSARSLAKQIAPEPSLLQSVHFAAIEQTSSQIKDVSSRLLIDFAPLLLSNIINILTGILNDADKVAEIAAKVDQNSPTNFTPEEIEELRKISARHIPGILELKKNYLNELLSNEVLRPKLLTLIIDSLIPSFFKQPSQNTQLQKMLTKAVFNGLHLFLRDLNRTTKAHKVDIKNAPVVFLRMHNFYTKEFASPIFTEKSCSIHQMQNHLRDHIFEIIKSFLTFVQAPEQPIDLPTATLIAFIPTIAEDLITKLLTPYTLTSLVTRFLYIYKHQEQASSTPPESIYKSPVFQGKEKSPPDENFANEVGDTLFKVIIEALTLSNFGAIATITNLFEGPIKPQLVAAARNIETNINDFQSNVCLYFLLEGLQTILYDKQGDNFFCAPQPIALLQKSTEEKDSDLQRMSDEISRSIDWKQLIDDELTKQIGWVQAKLIPTKTISREIPSLLAEIAYQPYLMYLMIAYILNSIQRQFKKIQQESTST